MVYKQNENKSKYTERDTTNEFFLEKLSGIHRPLTYSFSVIHFKHTRLSKKTPTRSFESFPSHFSFQTKSWKSGWFTIPTENWFKSDDRHFPMLGIGAHGWSRVAIWLILVPFFGLPTISTLVKDDRLMFTQDPNLYYTLPTYNTSATFSTIGIIAGSFRKSCETKNSIEIVCCQSVCKILFQELLLFHRTICILKNGVMEDTVTLFAKMKIVFIFNNAMWVFINDINYISYRLYTFKNFSIATKIWELHVVKLQHIFQHQLTNWFQLSIWWILLREVLYHINWG